VAATATGLIGGVMKTVLTALFAGVLFGAGLFVSEMVNPLRVRGFLDVTGRWDPSLALVMIGALTVTSVGYRLVFARAKPVFALNFILPNRFNIDPPLVLGAVLFGVGWGLSGLCPGPSLVSAASLNTDILLFVAAMLVGMKLHDVFMRK